MPAYDFRCEKCEEVFEVVRPGSDRSKVSCPVCGSPSRRVFSPVGVVFKGSGFHTTDYARASRPSEAGDAAKDTAAGAGSCGAAQAGGACESCPAKKG